MQFGLRYAPSNFDLFTMSHPFQNEQIRRDIMLMRLKGHEGPSSFDDRNGGWPLPLPLVGVGNPGRVTAINASGSDT